MSKGETKLQTDIINSVRRDGGYARKLSNRFQVGVPDLVISLPGFSPCFAEVKDFGAVKGDFDRNLGVTEKQALELKKISASQRYPIACLLIGFQMYKKRYLLYLPHSDRRVSSAALNGITAPIIKREVGQYYDVRRALRELGVARIVSSVEETMKQLERLGA